MSFSDSAPPFYPTHFSDNEAVGGFWPQFSINNEASEPHLEFSQPPPPKRSRNRDDDDDLPNSMPYPPMNPRITPSHPSNPPVNRGAANIFFKTRICSKFMVGACRNGESCKFAHGDEDIRKPPNNWQSLVAGRVEDRFTGNWENDEAIIQRMKLCKKFYNGEECPYGERCNFLHEDPSKFRADIGRYRESSAGSIGHRESSAITIGDTENSVVSNGFRESSAISIRTSDLPLGSLSDQPESNGTMNVGSDTSRVKPPFWKTKLCSKFQVTGRCPFGDKCHYAHGIADLQVPGGGRSPGEVGHVVSILPRPSPSSANDQLTVNAGAEESSKQEEEGKKCLLKFRGSKKINSIYGDWIDELPLAPSLPNKAET